MLHSGNTPKEIVDAINSIIHSCDEAEQSVDLREAFPLLVSSSIWKNVTALVPSDHRLSTDARLERFILHHIRLDGARALRYLKRHPDQAFSAQELWQALTGIPARAEHPSNPTSVPDLDLRSQPEGDLENPDRLVETGIPVTDEHCLREINRELGRLLRQREAALALRMDTAPLDGEIHALRKYLRESSYPDGRPRLFPGTNRRAAQSMSLSLKRFRERAAALDPELAVYMESHLGTSPQFVWISEGGIERRKREKGDDGDWAN